MTELEEAKTALGIVNAALSNLIQGKRVNQVTFSMGGDTRIYRYETGSPDALYKVLIAEQNRLMIIIRSLDATIKPYVRRNSLIPTVVTRGVF